MEYTYSATLDRVTKRTARFAVKPERGKPAAFSSIYVDKWALPDAVDKIPAGDVEGSDVSITVSITVPE